MNQGVIFSPDRNLHLALIYRNYSKAYYSFYSNAISESTRASNESGLFLCINYKIKRHWSLNSYLDIWKHPWLKFRVGKPSTGVEYAARLLFEQKDLLFYVKFSHESKDSDLGGTEAKYKITSRRQRSKIRFHLRNKLPGGLELRTRFELQMYSHSLRHQTGYLLFQDIIFRPIEYPLSFTARIAFFDIDSYDSRIYAYENALLNDSSISPYFQRGIRYYLNIRLKLTGHHIFEARLARTFNQNADSFSNALETIENDQRTEIRCQLRLRF